MEGKLFKLTVVSKPTGATCPCFSPEFAGPESAAVRYFLNLDYLNFFFEHPDYTVYITETTYTK